MLYWDFSIPNTNSKVYPDKPWDWEWLSENPNITWEIVRDNPDKDWNPIGIIRNPNIRLEDAEYYYQSHYSELYYSDLYLNHLLCNPIVNKRVRTEDTKRRQKNLEKIIDNLSPFSRNIDRIISKRITYV